MTKLSVNLNAVAMLRNRRDVGWPDVVAIARLVLQAGAHGITVHPRPDERHIRKTDVAELNELMKNEFPKAEFNVEGYPSDDFLALVSEIKPLQVTFVPDDPEQSTSDHGWDIDANIELLEASIARMKALDIRVSLFIDEDAKAPAKAKKIGADRVELYTGPYGASVPNSFDAQHHLARLNMTAVAAKAAGLGINAGHDLTLENLPAFIEAVPEVAEVSIGHGITADALLMGFAEAVVQYKAVLS